MAAVFTLWVASCATLYAQLNDSGKTLSSVLEAFPDEAPLVQASVVASAVCGALLLIKVDGKPIQKGSLQLVVHGQACFYTWWAQLRDASPIVPYATVGWFPPFCRNKTTANMLCARHVDVWLEMEHSIHDMHPLVATP